MNNEKVTISKEGLNRLEYAVNYLLHNITSLNDLNCDLCEMVCDLNGTEEQKLNAYEFIRNAPHIRALVYSMGDMLQDLTVLLEAVIGEVYHNEEKKENENAK